MPEAWANSIVTVASLYVAAGCLFAVPFVMFGVQRVDPVAREGTWGFRLLILPGVTALWPLLAWRLLRGNMAPPTEQNAHRAAAARMRPSR